jgi:thiaminase (transcriptional activator TenA)
VNLIVCTIDHSSTSFEARVRFGRFISVVAGEENTYFLRAFEALGVTEDRRTADPDTQATAGFKAIMRDATETRSYAATLSVLVVAEWLYLDWAPARRSRYRTTSCTPSGSCSTTIRIFATSSVSSARSLDRVGPAQAGLCRDFFRRAVALELSFFEAAYADRT